MRKRILAILLLATIAYILFGMSMHPRSSSQFFIAMHRFITLYPLMVLAAIIAFVAACWVISIVLTAIERRIAATKQARKETSD